MSANHNVKVHLPVVVVVFKIQYAVMLADAQCQIRPLEQCASMIAGRYPAPYSPRPITIQETIFTIFTLLLILDLSIISVLTCAPTSIDGQLMDTMGMLMADEGQGDSPINTSASAR